MGVSDRFRGFGVAAEDVLATPQVSNRKPQSIIDDLYVARQALAPWASERPADAVRYELETGEQVFGRSHNQQPEDYLRGLQNWLKANSDADCYDLPVARSIADDLRDALGRMP
ncbi:MAG: hypothetical protein LH624_14880 [Cryobacterium sp.]|nr:hypothetical protein [Cryobacterium sp.]